MFSFLVADSSKQDCEELESCCRNTPAIQLLPCVHTGQDILHALETQHIDVLIMDIVLPVLDGLSVLHHINAMPPAQRPAVFVHTAFLDNRMLHELQRLHVVYCFVKPMEPAYVVSRVLQLMQPDEAQSPQPYAAGIPAGQDGKEELGAEITRQIRATGVPAHLRGYHYLRAAIQYSVEAEDPSAIAITKDIYPMIAAQYHTRPTLVERSIRNAIEVAWTRGNRQVMQQYFGYTADDYKGKPTNAEFIAMIADHVRTRR